MDDEQATRAVAIYRDYYDTTGAYENEVYEGIEDLLRDLVAAGQRARRRIVRLERAEALGADRVGVGGELGTAELAVLGENREGRERQWHKTRAR